MAYAYNIYSAGSSQTDYTITFPYIKEEHVKVYVNYVDTSFTFHNATTARLASAPSSGTRVEVRRVTPPSAVLVDYADGSTLTASDLDTSNLQHLYIAQELDDSLKQGISISASTGLPTLGSQRLTNVADPTAAQDAATKNYVDTTRQPVDAELTELATMSSGTASSLADLTNTEVQILDGATVTTDELNKLDGVTATTAEINYVDGVTSNVQTQLDARQPKDAELTELATMHTDTAAALADLTQAEVQILDGATLSTAELNFVDGVTSALQTQLDAKQPLDADLTNLASCQSGAAANIALLTSGEVAILDGATVSTSELNTLSGINASTGELNKLDGVTATTANLNVVSGMTKATSLTSNSDTELPTSKAVADHVASSITALGGFVAINGPTNFPATQPAQGVVVSIKDVGSGFTTSSNEITITNGAGTNKNVKITGFPSEYAAATLGDDTGLQVTSDITNSTDGTPAVHRYIYHKQLAKESDVKALSDDINAFNARYRTATGSNPSSDNDAGDLFFSQDTDKMYVRNAANNAWDEVVSVGEFFINTLSSLGSGSDNPPGGSATFNGTARKFTLSNAPSVAQQLIVSINGVIQKPNSGTGFPSEGFSINGSALQLAAAPATGAPFFIITIGSTVNIGTPSAETVNLAKLDTSNTGSNGQVLSKSGATEGLTWIDSASEGTAVKSTTNSNEAVTKFLRADGDGTCSWQVPPDTVYTHPNHSGEVTSTADGATIIANNIVDEDNLKVDNSPTNDHVLTAKSSAAGGLTWAAVSSSDTLSFRNLIINGDCQINQRHGVGGHVTGLTNGASEFGADRWQIKITNPSGGTWAFNHTDTSYEAGGFRRSVQLALTGTAQATSAAETMIYIRYTVEAKDAVRLAWGTGSAKQLTLSFWMNCNVAGDGQVNIQHGDGSKRVSGTYTYSSAGSWEKKTITFPASAEEVNNDNGVGFRVEWVVCAGADAKTGSVQTSWATPAEGDRGAGQTINIATTVGHKFAITGVQLEEGATATAFERKSYADELRACERYYQVIGDVDNNPLCNIYGESALIHGVHHFRSEMRAVPSVHSSNSSDHFKARIGVGNHTFDTCTFNDSSNKAVIVYGNLGSGTYTNYAGILRLNHNDAYLSAQAEL